MVSISLSVRQRTLLHYLTFFLSYFAPSVKHLREPTTINQNRRTLGSKILGYVSNPNLKPRFSQASNEYSYSTCTCFRFIFAASVRTPKYSTTLSHSTLERSNSAGGSVSYQYSQSKQVTYHKLGSNMCS